MNTQKIIERMLGKKEPNILMTDGYKFAMAQAGFPLRQETFYLSFRKPGWYFVPFDLAAVIQGLYPKPPAREELAYLEKAGYGLNPAMVEAIQAEAVVRAVPEGSWVREREPIFSVTAPSFLASWLESMAIWLQFPIQVATEAMKMVRQDFVCTCEGEAAIAELTLTACGVKGGNVRIEDHYQERVKAHAVALVNAVDGQGERIFEVGMRGATCMEMHRMALRACKEAGIAKTSNVFLARELGMIPVGTTGHEHQQRWGNDAHAFRAIRDMRPQPPSYLFDTYDAQAIGIPAAIKVIRENSGKPCSVRFDSGDQQAQLLQFIEANVEPVFVFMDSMNPLKVKELEAFARSNGIPEERRLYGAGGFLVGKPAQGDLTRDRVSAVYKLSQTGPAPVMKFSVPEKSTVPGIPVIFRRHGINGPIGLIGQLGEQPPLGFHLLKDSKTPESGWNRQSLDPVGLSDATAKQVDALVQQQLKACDNTELTPIEPALCN